MCWDTVYGAPRRLLELYYCQRDAEVLPLNTMPTDTDPGVLLTLLRHDANAVADERFTLTLLNDVGGNLVHDELLAELLANRRLAGGGRVPCGRYLAVTFARGYARALRALLAHAEYYGLTPRAVRYYLVNERQCAAVDKHLALDMMDALLHWYAHAALSPSAGERRPRPREDDE
jgi:hypothetical protein